MQQDMKQRARLERAAADVRAVASRHGIGIMFFGSFVSQLR